MRREFGLSRVGRPGDEGDPGPEGITTGDNRDDQAYLRFQDTLEPAVELHHLVAAEQAIRTDGGPVARWWSDLSAAAESAVTASSIDDLLRLVLEMTCSALGAEAAAFLTSDRSGAELTLRRSFGVLESRTRTLPTCGRKRAVQRRRGARPSDLATGRLSCRRSRV